MSAPTVPTCKGTGKAVSEGGKDHPAWIDAAWGMPPSEAERNGVREAYYQGKRLGLSNPSPFASHTFCHRAYTEGQKAHKDTPSPSSVREKTMEEVYCSAFNDANKALGQEARIEMFRRMGTLEPHCHHQALQAVAAAAVAGKEEEIEKQAGILRELRKELRITKKISELEQEEIATLRGAVEKQWISIEDKLPQGGRELFLTWVSPDEELPHCEVAVWYKGEFNTSPARLAHFITHWMPPPGSPEALAHQAEGKE